MSRGLRLSLMALLIVGIYIWWNGPRLRSEIVPLEALYRTEIREGDGTYVYFFAIKTSFWDNEVDRAIAYCDSFYQASSWEDSTLLCFSFHRYTRWINPEYAALSEPPDGPDPPNYGSQQLFQIIYYISPPVVPPRCMLSVYVYNIERVALLL